MIPNVNVKSGTFSALAIPNHPRTDLQALDEKIKSMMEKGQKMIPNGKQANGTPRQATSFICKVCGKEEYEEGSDESSCWLDKEIF